MSSVRSFAKGTVIFKEGDKGDVAYLLESGKVHLFKTVSGRRIEIGAVGPWHAFGELALLDNAPRMAAAIAAEDCVCRILSRDHVDGMLDQAPQGLVTLMRGLAHTIRSMGDQLAETKAELLEQRR